MRKFVRRIRFMFNIRRFIPFLFEFFTTHAVPVRSKLLSIALLVGYILFPFDLIPDFLTMFGLLDDVAVLTFVMQRIVSISPQHLKEKYGLE